MDLHFNVIFQQIEEYHKQLGHINPSMECFRNHSLALMMELAELIESVPWKPWREEAYSETDIDNATREVVDIIFFLVALCEILQITPQMIEDKFQQVLKNNYARLESGYSKRG